MKQRYIRAVRHTNGSQHLLTNETAKRCTNGVFFEQKDRKHRNSIKTLVFVTYWYFVNSIGLSFIRLPHSKTYLLMIVTHILEKGFRLCRLSFTDFTSSDFYEFVSKKNQHKTWQTKDIYLILHLHIAAEAHRCSRKAKPIRCGPRGGM